MWWAGSSLLVFFSLISTSLTPVAILLPRGRPPLNRLFVLEAISFLKNLYLMIFWSLLCLVIVGALHSISGWIPDSSSIYSCVSRTGIILFLFLPGLSHVNLRHLNIEPAILDISSIVLSLGVLASVSADPWSHCMAPCSHFH